MHLKLRWRLLMFLALFLYILLAFCVVWLLAHSIVFAVIFGTTLMLLIYAVWLLVSKSNDGNMWRRGLLLVVTAGLVSELIFFLSDKKNRQAVLVIAGLTLLYMLLYAVLRKKYWHEVRRSVEQAGGTAHFTHPFLIVNPKSGDGRAIKAHIPELAERQGIQVLMTQKGGSVEDVAQQAVDAGADVLGISGGDGSIGAVAKVAIENNLPIVVLPGGTRCHFARDLGLEPKQIVDSLSSYTGVERRIDAGEINGRIFLNNASFGLYADIVDHPQYREHKLDVGREVLSSLVQGKKSFYDLQFSHEKINVSSAVQVLIGINRYNTVNLFELGHREQLDGGVLQVNAVTKLNDTVVRQLLRDISIPVLKKQESIDGFFQWEEVSFQVHSGNKRLVVGVDGEREEFNTPVSIRVIPSALRVYVPAEGERNRRKNPFSMAVARREWQVAKRSTSL